MLLIRFLKKNLESVCSVFENDQSSLFFNFDGSELTNYGSDDDGDERIMHVVINRPASLTGDDCCE